MTTTEPCPTCGTIAECEHCSGTHIWNCPECGEIISDVFYECEDCKQQMTTSDNLSERIRFEAWAAQLEAELSDLRRQLAALQPQPAVGIGNENPRMSYDKLSDILIIRNGDRDSYIRYIDGDIALVCEVDTDKVVGFEVEGFSIRAGLDRQPQPAPSPADTEAVREMFERDHWRR